MEITEFLLENEGAVVIKARNGKEAAEIFERSEKYGIDVVLMDITAPETDGFSASEAIRSLKRADALATPIIVLTANIFTDGREKTELDGMDGHLAKPIESAELKKVLYGYTGTKTLTIQECYENIGSSYDSVKQRLKCDDESIAEAIKFFMHDDHIITFFDAIYKHDVQKAFIAAHTLKGISANLGFDRLLSVFSDITQYLRKEDYDKAAELVTAARNNYVTVINAFRRCKGMI